MIRVLINTLKGAVIGALISLLLYVLGFCAELVNCTCQILTCDWNGDDLIPYIWESGSFVSILLFCTIAGAVIGLVYGIYKMKATIDEEARLRAAADSEKAKNQRIKWAGEVKQKAWSIANSCEKNAKDYKALMSPNYKADSQMEKIMKELANATELNGKVDAMANDAKTKGGASK